MTTLISQFRRGHFCGAANRRPGMESRLQAAGRGQTRAQEELSTRATMLLPRRLKPGLHTRMRKALPSRNSGAFSIIEIMVTVALLSVIVLGLVAMFDQTRKALQASLTQSGGGQDVRAAMEMIRLDLEQLTPTYAPNNNPLVFGSTNNSLTVNFAVRDPGNYEPLVQPLMDPTEFRTNALQQMFLVTRGSPNNNQAWNAIGYKIDTTGQANGVGTLYRYYAPGVSITNRPTVLNPYASLANQFPLFAAIDPTVSATNNPFSKIMDGVVQFRIRAYDTNGILITNTLYSGTGTNTATNIFALPNRSLPGYANDNGYTYFYNFVSNAVPAFVEVELGVLDDQTYQKYLAFTNAPGPVALNYLTSHAGQLRIYRQRVPIHAVDSSAYP